MDILLIFWWVRNEQFSVVVGQNPFEKKYDINEKNQ